MLPGRPATRHRPCLAVAAPLHARTRRRLYAVQMQDGHAPPAAAACAQLSSCAHLPAGDDNQPPARPLPAADIPRQSTVKLFCPKCEDVYYPRSKYHGNLDGEGAGQQR